MGFKYTSTKRRGKNAPQKASGIGMLAIMITMAFSVWLGYWLPRNYDVRTYVPLPADWSPLTISILVGLTAFILLQFVIVLLSGILFPLPPQDEFDEDGLIKRK